MDFFKKKLTTDEFRVLFEIVQIFSYSSTPKQFNIQQFLDSYSTVSNQKIYDIKKNFIQLVQILQKYDLIEPNYKIISNGSFLDTDQLTISNISEGFLIYENISI